MQPPARRDRGETCTPRAARATRPPFPATAGGGPAPGAQACATIGALPSLRDLHAPYGSRGATALPGHGQRRACATRTCVCRHRRVAIAARPARPVRLARRDRPPRPQPAGCQRRAAHVCVDIGASPLLRDLHAPCGFRDATALPSHGRRRTGAGPHMCVLPLACRRCGGPARPAQLARRDRPPRPQPLKGQRRAAHACSATRASPSARVGHAPCSSRDVTAPRGHGRRRASAGQHMLAPPSARRDRGETRSRRAEPLASRQHQFCRRRRDTIALDELAKCCQHSAVVLPSSAGGGQRRTAAPSATAGASRSSETSTPSVVSALQSLSQAELAEGSATWPHRVSQQVLRDRVRRARHV